MAYQKLNWLNKGETGAIPINKTNLNHMDDGIATNDEAVGELSNLNTTNKENLVESINEINNKFDYSDTEKIVGKWINNKPIYSKTINFEVENNSDKSINYNIQNVENIWIDESASYIMGEYETLAVNWYYSSSDWCRTWANKNQGYLRFKCPSSLGTRTCYVTLRYTKTTD